MYEMAKKAREAMRGKAKRLAGEKDQKVDSSNWTPGDPMDADVKTGMRPISKQGFKRGGKIAGEKAMTHAGRKPRKSGGRAITADSLINRDQKEANEGREGKKHIGGMKKGGRAEKAMGGSPTDMLKTGMNPQAYIKNVLGPTMGLKKGGKIGKSNGGTLERIKNPNPSPDYQPSKPDPDYKVEGGPSDKDKDDLTKKIEGLKKGGRAARKAGGNVNYGPMEMPAGKKGMSTSEQVALEKKQDAASKPTRGKAGHYADGGMAPYGATAPVAAAGPDPKSIVQKNAMNFGMGTSGSPYKKGGMAKFEGSAKDEAQDKKLAKKHGMSMKAWEASKMDTKHDRQESMKGLKDGGKADGKWISKAIGKPGALHKSLGVPAGEKIPAKKLEKAEASKNPKLAKRAHLAETLKHISRANKFGGGALSDGPKKGGKGKTNINILINPGAKPDQAGGMPPMPPGLPPRPTGGIPVPMGMPPAGGAAPMPMPMPMPSAPAPGGMPAMGRKAGGKVYKSYKDLDAGAGSGLGRLEKTEIQKRKA
jgi:hypothetical protein